jgi:hypothetical protein
MRQIARHASEVHLGAGSEATPPRRRFQGLHPLLFAAYPVLFLWSQNVGEVTLADVVRPLFVVIPIAAVATFVLGRVLGDSRRGALIVTPIVIALLMYGHLSRLLDAAPDVEAAGGSSGAAVTGSSWTWLLVLAILIGMVIGGVVLALRLDGRRLASLDTGLLRIGALLLVVTLIPIGLQATSLTNARATLPATGHGTTAPADSTPGSSAPVAATPTSAKKRDVYWLVFDRYGSDESLRLRYKFENDLTPWLTDQGFTVLPDSHANYGRTALSIATTLNMEPLEELDGYVGRKSTDLGPVNRALQGSKVAQQFKDLGYRYLHVGSWWTPTTTDSLADVNYDASDVADFSEALVDMSVMPALAGLAGLGDAAPTRERRHYLHGRYELDVLDRIGAEPGPKFVMAHVLLPHPPQVFQRDGSFSQDDRGRDGLLDQYAYTNERIRGIVERLLDVPEEDQPIIILQADEGPFTQAYAKDKVGYDWATATPEELEMKWGILNAWHVPDGVDLGLYPTMTSINTFPALFERYFGIKTDRLPDRVYSSASEDLPYDLTDITDRLPGPH